MPSTYIDGKLVKTWSVDGKAVKTASVDGKLCYQSTLASGTVQGTASLNQYGTWWYKSGYSKVPTVPNPFGTLSPSSVYIGDANIVVLYTATYSATGGIPAYTEAYVGFKNNGNSPAVPFTSVTFGSVKILKSAMSVMQVLDVNWNTIGPAYQLKNPSPMPWDPKSTAVNSFRFD